MKTKFTKKEIIVVLACAVFMLLNIGAIGSGGRRRAKEMVCLSNLRHWGKMFEMFTNDNNGYFNRGWDIGEEGLWMNALRPYYKDNWRLLMCPEATNMYDWGVFKAWQRNVNLPEGGEHSYVSSYGINSWTNNMSGDRGARPVEWFWKNVRGVEGRNSIPVFADSVWHDAWPRHTDYPAPVPDGLPVGADEMMRFCIDRHNGAINMLFMDFSARKIGLKELWTLKWHRNFYTDGPWTRAGGVRPSDWPHWMRNFKDY
jgi:prepilin-type processing-associated H-X9-DG protein